MVEFEMCEFCKHQYTSKEERRFHAQTISCHHCGPQLAYAEKGHKVCFEDEALYKAIETLNAGDIIAIKGIGGYHLACSAMNESAVRKLRILKGREAKPFAVMFRNMDEIKKHCIVSEKESQLLQGKEKPIVLLEQKNSAIPEEVSKGSRFTGCFLPYTPLQKLILMETPPLVMTSANISDSPIIKEDVEMLSMLGGSLAGVLYNGRDIRVGIDDSVIKTVDDDVQFFRRARGYVPLPVYIKGIEKQYKGDILATGGQTKNTFCLLKQSDRMSGNLAYLSQHIGDLDDLRTYDSYLYNIEHMKALLRVKPERICCDLHPGYASTRYAESLGAEIIRVQHHYAI
jgi:hydrogenase maturation protein HypF